MTLIGEGLVDHRTNGGYRVAMMTAREFGEIYLVREALESAALRAAVAGATAEDDGLARAALRALGDACAGHHARLQRFISALPQHTGLFVEEDIQFRCNLVAKPSQVTGVPYPVINRVAFGVLGANVPAIIRA